MFDIILTGTIHCLAEVIKLGNSNHLPNIVLLNIVGGIKKESAHYLRQATK